MFITSAKDIVFIGVS